MKRIGIIEIIISIIGAFFMYLLSWLLFDKEFAFYMSVFMFLGFLLVCYVQKGEFEKKLSVNENTKSKIEIGKIDRIKKYGKCSTYVEDETNKFFSLSGDTYNSYEIYEDSNVLCIITKKEVYELKFCDIISADITQYNITPTSKMETDTSNMIGRAIVGGAVAGTAGAMVGAVTARKTNTINYNDPMVKEEMTKGRLDITINNFNNPIIQIEYSGTMSMKYIYSLKSVIIDIIISKNKQSDR